MSANPDSAAPAGRKKPAHGQEHGGRARFPHEVAMLRQLAPDNVVHDEMEAGIKMLRLCARGYERDESDLFPNVSV